MFDLIILLFLFVWVDSNLCGNFCLYDDVVVFIDCELFLVDVVLGL